MEDVRITLRVPKDLYDKVVKASESEQRSVNGQIVFILKKHLNK